MAAALLLACLWATLARAVAAQGEFYGGALDRGGRATQAFGQGSEVSFSLAGGGTWRLASDGRVAGASLQFSSFDPRPLDVQATLVAEDPSRGLSRGAILEFGATGGGSGPGPGQGAGDDAGDANSGAGGGPGEDAAGNEKRRYSFKSGVVVTLAFNVTNLTAGAGSVALRTRGTPANDPDAFVWARYDDDAGSWVPLSKADVAVTGDGLVVASIPLVSESYALLERVEPEFPVEVVVLLSLLAVAAAAVAAVLSKREYREVVRRRFFGRHVVAHRLSIDDVLENENRSRIIDAVLDEPGIHFNRLRQVTGLTPGVLTWHLEVLERYGVLKSARAGQYLCFFPAVDANPVDPADAELAKSSTTLDVLSRVREAPGCTQKDLAAALGRSPATVSYHVEKLVNRGLLRAEGRGRGKRLYAVELESEGVERAGR
ncbi:MAG: hypothetical protein Kow0069_07730 [Promethearchaeota archaeon]